MALDDMLKGMAVFKDGLTQFATSKAVNDANEQLSQLNGQEMDRGEMLKAQSQIGNDLMMRLQSAGADPGRIAQLTGQIAPSAGAQYQAEENKNLQESSQTFQAKEKDKDRAHDIRLQGMKNSILEGGANSKLSKFTIGEANKFYKREQKSIEAIDGLSKFSKMINTPGAARIGIELGKTALLKDAGEDRITNEDIERADNDPSIREKIARRLKLEVTGDELKDKAAFYSKLMERLEQDALERLDKKIGGEAKAKSGLMEEIDEDKYGGALRKMVPALERMKKPGAGNPLADAEAWLQKNPSHPMAGAMRVKLEKMKKEAQVSAR